jgi:hypothetical protein
VTASPGDWPPYVAAIVLRATPARMALAVVAPTSWARRAAVNAPSFDVASPSGAWSTAACASISRARCSSAMPLPWRWLACIKPCVGVPKSARLPGWMSSNSLRLLCWPIPQSAPHLRHLHSVSGCSTAQERRCAPGKPATPRPIFPGSLTTPFGNRIYWPARRSRL